MGFAEQLAARAAETKTHSHNPSRARRKIVPSGSSPPRPGKVVAPSLSSSAGAKGSSSNMFADQLKRRAGNEGESSSSTTAEAARALDHSFAVADHQQGGASTTSSLTATPQHASPASQSGASRHRDDLGRRASEKVKPLLVPTCKTPNSPSSLGSDDEEDEYSSVGFSLMDASTVSSVGGESVDGRGQTKVSPLPKLRKKKKKRIRPVESPAPRADQEETALQEDTVSPLAKREVGRREEARQLSSVQTYPTQQQIEGELQSRLQQQRLKSQNIETPSQPTAATEEKRATDGKSDLDIASPRSTDSDNAAVFGAWAQIESLKRKVAEAEEQARRESLRAESASRELRLAREGSERGDSQASLASRENDASVAAGDNSGVMQNTVPETTAVDGAAQEVAAESATPATQPSSGAERADAPAVPSVARKDDAQQWRKRALEAEERLARDVERAAAATAPTPPAPQAAIAARLEESDIIRLKNAEIDVLRSQIHRLERRIQEECERNEDLLRTSSYHHHPDGPPLVVASEWMSSGSTMASRTADVGELRLLREEIRHLQYQLGRGHGTASTTGESTLSSLEGNEEPERDEEGEEEVDDNEMQASSSFWGLCCVRKSRRGYGRV